MPHHISSSSASRCLRACRCMHGPQNIPAHAARFFSIAVIHNSFSSSIYSGEGLHCILLFPLLLCFPLCANGSYVAHIVRLKPLPLHLLHKFMPDPKHTLHALGLVVRPTKSLFRPAPSACSSACSDAAFHTAQQLYFRHASAHKNKQACMKQSASPSGPHCRHMQSIACRPHPCTAGTPPAPPAWNGRLHAVMEPSCMHDHGVFSIK